MHKEKLISFIDLRIIHLLGIKVKKSHQGSNSKIMPVYMATQPPIQIQVLTHNWFKGSHKKITLSLNTLSVYWMFGRRIDREKKKKNLQTNWDDKGMEK